MMEAGVRLGQHRILDPASGGAAFLVPLAARIAETGHKRGAQAKAILQDIERTLHGIEIEPGLADQSHALLSDLLSAEIESSGVALNGLVQRADTLELGPPDALYDAVIGNPPYGRILRPSAVMLKRYRSVIADGYVNLYALFVEQVLQLVRPGGLICLIIPMSFVGGPYFAELRKRILQCASVLRLDPIDKRSDVFLDVLYDLCVIVMRRHGGPDRPAAPKSALLRVGEPNLDLGALSFPAVPDGRVWVLPDDGESSPMFRPVSRHWPITAMLPRLAILCGIGRSIATALARDPGRMRSRSSGHIMCAPTSDASRGTWMAPRLGLPRFLRAAVRSFAPKLSSCGALAIGGKGGG
jgi:adenine-specific DNA-methyltransferase